MSTLYDVVASVKPLYLLGCTGEFGCDCVYVRAKYMTRMQNLKGHGSRSKYQKGCRCPLCKRANSGYTKLYRDRKQNDGHPNP